MQSNGKLNVLSDLEEIEKSLKVIMQDTEIYVTIGI